jgi:5-methylcytosine-specific restriction endonuclease McrA
MSFGQFKGPYRRKSRVPGQPKLDIRKENGEPWLPSNSNSTRRGEKKAASDTREVTFSQRVKRQKGLCWFCNELMGYDCTREHLLAKARGGSNDPKNIRAAHGDCNSAAGHLPVKRKYELRKIGHAAGRLAVLEAAHRMRRHETYQVFTEKLEAPKGRFPVTVIEGEKTYDKLMFSAAAKARERREIAMRTEANRVKREARKHYWAKLGLLQKPDWWDG